MSRSCTWAGSWLIAAVMLCAACEPSEDAESTASPVGVSATDGDGQGTSRQDAIATLALDRLAAAIIGVRRIDAVMATQLEEQGAQESRMVQAAAAEASTKAIQRTGLRVEDYNRMLQLVASNPGLRIRLDRRLRAQGQPPLSEADLGSR